jgi:subtilisin family serine protease
MRTFSILLFLFASSLFAAPPKIGEDVYRDLAAHESVQVIVMLREPGVASKAGAMHAERDAVIRDTPTLSVVRSWTAVPGFAATIGRKALPALEANPSVTKVDLDAGGSYALAQSVPLIHGDIVRNLGYTGAGVTVAVLDSGADLTHPDLRDAITAEACFCGSCCPAGGSTQFGAGAGRDENGHGTNVAGIVASRGIVSSKGVAPGAKLVIVRVLDRNGSFASTSQVVSGLDWILTQHPEVKVVNMSLLTNALFGGYCDNAAAFTMAFASVIDQLHAAGVTVFACSGNGSQTVQMPAPACIFNAVSVGAVWKADVGPVSIFSCSDATTAADQITCFSNTNTTLDLLAPGAPITSDGLSGGRSTYYGTSQATPHAAGAAAVLLAINPTLTPNDVEHILENSGKPILDPRTGTFFPRIDLAAAVQAVPKPAHGPRRRAVRH